jgi:hypothetical protein
MVTLEKEEPTEDGMIILACGPALQRIQRAISLHLAESEKAAIDAVNKVLDSQENRWRKLLQGGCRAIQAGLPDIRAVLFFGRVFNDEDSLALVEGSPAQVVHEISSSTNPVRISSRRGIAGLAFQTNQTVRSRPSVFATLSSFAQEKIQGWVPLETPDGLWSDRKLSVMAIPVQHRIYGSQENKAIGVFLIGRNISDGFWGCEELIGREIANRIIDAVTRIQLKEDVKRAVNAVSGFLGFRDDEREDLQRWAQKAEQAELQLLLKHHEGICGAMSLPLRQQIERCKSFIQSTGTIIRRVAPATSYFAVAEANPSRNTEGASLSMTRRLT